MTCSRKWWWAAALAYVFLAGCGSDDSSAPPAVPPTGGTPLAQAIANAAAVPANDTSSNSSSAFKVLQDNGVTAITVTGAPVVNFTVFSDSAVKQGLTLSNVSFAIAKLVPGTNGEIDQWQSYVYRTESTANAPNNVGSGPNGTPVLASAVQATTDPKPAGQAGQLLYNAEGYYTYTFSTNITDPGKTNGIVFEPNRTHRIAIQLSYKNAAGETVLVNPYFDVTFDANGKSVPVTDPSKTRVMADVSSCNGCHERLALHGGGRVDVQYCVMCHNPGTTDANSGNVLTMQTMVHKIHAGRLLASQAATGGGENYVIWGYQSVKHDYSEVGFPQDLRNCSVCHSGANPKTPQGDNWKTRASKESCLTCHASGTGSAWVSSHQLFADLWGGAGTPAKNLPNSECVRCHETPSFSPARVHFNQNEENAAKYKVNIESATYDAGARKVTVKYLVTDPTNGNVAYNLVTPDCTGSGAAVSCSSDTQFGNLSLYLAYQSLVGQPLTVTEFTSYNNGGRTANAYMYQGTNDGANRYTIAITLPPDTATAVAAGTARVVSIGQIREPLLDVKSEQEPRPPVKPTTLINVVAQHTYRDVVISGDLNPRRQVVSNEKCNVCHGALGTTTGSNTVANAFHRGARNTVESCALCHDALRSSSTVMTNGQNLQESYQFKRMIHGIHGSSKRIHPFTYGNAAVGAFCNPRNPASVAPLCDPNLTLAADVLNYAAEVAYPDLGLNCDNCHVNRSYMSDPGGVGAVVSPRVAGADPLGFGVISPLAATCTSCHDSPRAIQHVTQAGNSAFGTRTLGQDRLVKEVCADCHAPGGFQAVDFVHGLK